MATAITRRVINPYVAPREEIHNDWVQMGDGIFVSPYLAAEENGGVPITGVNFYDALCVAGLAGSRSEVPLYLSSCKEILYAIMNNETAGHLAGQYIEWSRNEHREIKFNDGTEGTMLLSHGLGGPTFLDGKLVTEWVAGFDDATGAINATTVTQQDEFGGSYFYQGVNPVLREWLLGRHDFDARCGALNAGEALGLRFSAYERDAFKLVAERLDSQNRVLREKIERSDASAAEFAKGSF